MKLVGATDPGAGDVELAVGEARILQPHADLLEGLALAIVDGHGKGRTQRILATLPLEAGVPFLRTQLNARNEDIRASAVT